MKTQLLIAITFLTINTFSQFDDFSNNIVNVKSIKETEVMDTLPKIFYVNKNNSEQNPAIFINGQFISGTILKTLNPGMIEEIKIDKGEIEIGKVNYYGQVYIKTKGNYNPKLISLNDLKSKYTDLKYSSTIFIIDNETIIADYDNYLVDENFILQIIVEKIDNKQEKLKFNIVKLITRIEENIKKSKEIRVRGIEDTATK
jgi:hypothetical protein